MTPQPTILDALDVAEREATAGAVAMAQHCDSLARGQRMTPRDSGGAPNPGSDEARALGCRCPVFDNNHGRFAPWPPDGWWVVEDCPVHVLSSPPSGAEPTEPTREET